MRRPPTIEERSTFTAAVRQQQAEARHDQGYALDAALDRTAQAAVDRVALQNVLVALGLLDISTRQGPMK